MAASGMLRPSTKSSISGGCRHSLPVCASPNAAETELCGILGDGRSGGAVIRVGFLLDAVIEPDTGYHLRQLVLPLQAAPSLRRGHDERLRRGHDELEDHQFGRLA